MHSKDDKTEKIGRGLERIADIINNLKSFSRVDQAENREIDINQSINEAIDLLNVQSGKEVEFIKDFSDVPLFECNQSEINQCLLYTVSNALDACEGKGAIRITTLYNETEKRIVIKVKDNGKGMSPVILSKVFNPFFATKEIGSETGIGMTITERIIKRHHGKISLDSTEGEGTTVTIELPV